MSGRDEAEGLAREMLESFRDKRDRAVLSAADAREIADKIARRLLATSETGYLGDAVTLIAEMTVADQPGIRRAAVQSLFQQLIEPLNDSFDPKCADLADQIMAQLIVFHRLRESAFGETLSRFGEFSESDLLKRRSRAARHTSSLDPHRLKRAIILSRVTIGADVAVTSVIGSHLRAFSPAAEIVLVGGLKLNELFGGDPRLRFCQLGYERGGQLTDRLAAWTRLIEIVEEETKGLDADEFLVIDPDSRMTQLGLLPVTIHEDSYALFDSRRFSGTQNETLGDAAARWAAIRWPLGARKSSPFLAPVEASVVTGSRVVSALKESGKRPVVFVSLGVGGNEGKRVSALFEELLVRRLANRTTLIIDKGATVGEHDQVERLIRVLANDGRSISEGGDTAYQAVIDSQPDVVIWRGGIGSFAGLVAACDAYLGYDSAGQHIAAALGRPALTIFVNGSTPRFAERWRPTGSTQSRVLSLTPEVVRREPVEDLVAEACALISEICGESL